MKRRTKNKLNQWLLYAALLAVVVALGFVADWSAIRQNFLDPEAFKAMWPEIVTVGAKNTVIYTVVSFVGGLILALVLALMKLSPVGPYRWLATTYIEFFRGLPALLVIIGFVLVVPIAFNYRFPAGAAGGAVAALVVVSAAYMAETLRAGIQAVPKGQEEAARSLGMSPARTMFSVTIPQAIRVVIPPLTNEFVLLLKDTSLITAVGAAAGSRELLAVARDGLVETASGTPLLMAAVMYLVITLPLTQLVAWLERRQGKSR